MLSLFICSRDGPCSLRWAATSSTSSSARTGSSSLPSGGTLATTNAATVAQLPLRPSAPGDYCVPSLPEQPRTASRPAALMAVVQRGMTRAASCATVATPAVGRFFFVVATIIRLTPFADRLRGPCPSNRSTIWALMHLPTLHEDS